jgi:hypothetical protein
MPILAILYTGKKKKKKRGGDVFGHSIHETNEVGSQNTKGVSSLDAR